MPGDGALTMADLMLMGVLRHGPARGYAIIAALRERSDGQFDLAEGTIYPHCTDSNGPASSRARLTRRRGGGDPRTR
jgi:hypothetical protein